MTTGSVIDQVAIEGKLACIFLSVHNSAGTLDADGVSAGAGTTLLGPMTAALELHALQMDTGDELYWLIDKSQLWWFDLVNHDIMSQVVWGHRVGVADAGVDWVVDCKGFASLAAVTDTRVSPDGTCTHAAITHAATVDAVEETAKLGFNMDLGELKDDAMIGFCCTLADRGATDANEIELHGVRIWGTMGLTSPIGRQEFT